MKNILIAVVAFMAFMIAPASATPVTYVQYDENPDYVLAAPGAPENSTAATDLQWIKITADPNVKPRTVKMVFKLADYNPDFGYEIGALMRHDGKTTGQIFALPGQSSYVNERPDFTKDEQYYCTNSSVKVVGNRVVLKFTYFCLPLRKGTFSVYAYSFVNDKNQTLAAVDSFKTPTKEFDFSYK